MQSDSEDFKASCVPVMSCAEAKTFEKNFFSTQSEITEDVAMRHAGAGIGAGVIRACGNAISRVLVLVGKGHNGGDAILAAVKIFSQTACRVDLVLFVDYEGSLSELTRAACEDLSALVPAEKRKIWLFEKEAEGLSREFLACIRASDVVLDGVFGHGFRPPFPPKMRACIEAIYAELAARGNAVRCAVDLPSGLCDSGAENCPAPADITFAAGIVKTPLIAFPQVSGRIVPVKVGFPCAENASTLAVADEAWAEAGIFARRPAFCDKRAFGHTLIVGGSRAMPGALMLNVLATLRAGTGLVSVICPESVHAAFAARAPGAMWIPCKENSAGGLDCSAALAHFRALLPRVSAVLCGSGMGASKNTQSLIEKIAFAVPAEIPLVLDADALRSTVLVALRSRGAPAEKTILLPHNGEFFRMGGNSSADAPRDFCREHNATLVLKGGPSTRIANAEREVVASPGSPVLARGGSGDVLAGIVVGMFASGKNFCGKISALERATAAVIWHGNAARRLASARGERCADIASLPDYLSPAGAGSPFSNNAL